MQRTGLFPKIHQQKWYWYTDTPVPHEHYIKENDMSLDTFLTIACLVIGAISYAAYRYLRENVRLKF